MAVINRTECFIESIRRVQGIVLFLVLLGVTCTLSSPQSDCNLVKNDLMAKGFTNTAIILNKSTNGEFCGENSCCGNDLEREMYQINQNNIEKYLRDSIIKLSTLIDVRARKFDGFFREMMNNSKREFHEMFERTYGKIYLQNADVFSDFFTQLETYYKKGSIRLSETMDTFFGILYQRMFTVLNSQYTFDDKYLECVTEHMVEMKPFGDVPHKLSMQLTRSFVATRTYYKSLMKGADVVMKMINLKIDNNCLNDLMKMQSCGLCKGQQGTGACSNYCTNVLELCLRYHSSFSTEWDNFVDSLDKVADRLIGPFNIEMVVEPLNIKISEAIMNFQDNGVEVSKKIYSLCGKPAVNRRKRNFDDEITTTTITTTSSISTTSVEDNPSYEIKYKPIRMNGKKKKVKKVEEDDNLPTLEKLIKEIKLKVRESRQFWLHLPYQYCNNPTISAPPSDNGKCWNGTSVGNYEKSSSKSNVSNKLPLVNEQIYTLQILIDKLRKAHQGDEVEIIDDAEEILDGSGSGSGDGSPDDTEGDGDIHSPDITIPSEEFPNEVPPIITSSTSTPQVIQTYSNANTISLSRALAQYLLPIVLVWFGGAISDLL